MDPAAREALNRRLMESTLNRSVAALGGRRTVVVSTSDEVLAYGRRLGCLGVAEGADADLNAALAQAAAVALADGAQALLVIPADLVLMTVEDLCEAREAVLDATGMVIWPDRRAEGTNLLGLRPPRADLFRFGDASCDRHRAAASDAGIALRVIQHARISFDLDTPEHLLGWRGLTESGS